MKKSFSFILTFGILFLFLIQMTGTLVESIYILDLMNTSLDEKALGLLFFFAPALLLILRKRTPDAVVWGLAGVLFLSRGLAPTMSTVGRMLASGLGTGCALLLLALLLTARPKGEKRPQAGLWISGGLALAVSLSALLRTVNYSIDYSLTPAGSWTGWLLGLALLWLLAQLDWSAEPSAQKRKPGLTGALLGLYLTLTLIYFAFSAPGVIARWTEGSYPLIVGIVVLLSAAWTWMIVFRAGLADRLPRGGLLIWNLAFTLCLVATILAKRVAFPVDPTRVVLVPGGSGVVQLIPLALMLLLFPVLYLDLRLFADRIRAQAPAPADLAPGMLLGSLALVLLVFINIFTNVWGYIEPVSTPFRNLFWLPYLLSAGGLSLLVWLLKPGTLEPTAHSERFSWGWTAFLGLIFLVTVAASLRTAPAPVVAEQPDSLLVMTYNIQAGNDGEAEPAYERQLALIRQVSPDVLALQESDTARISLNNNDLVRYFAGSLGYYAYYGPTPVTGTFGTAILSKYPLENPGVIFAASDTDEIGTAVVEIQLADRRFTIYNVHPDGSAGIKLAWAETLLAQMRGKPDVIVLGDFNTRKDDPGYKLFAAEYTNAWTSVYPSEISPDGVDMSGRNRIDHIFVSPSLSVVNPVYVLPPESATDHPVHWAEVIWGK